jgi:hypothetical protein
MRPFASTKWRVVLDLHQANPATMSSIDFFSPRAFSEMSASASTLKGFLVVGEAFAVEAAVQKGVLRMPTRCGGAVHRQPTTSLFLRPFKQLDRNFIVLVATEIKRVNRGVR